MSGASDRIGPPEKLTSNHDFAQFHCGEPTLDDWLRKRALPNEQSAASRTYVICIGRRVVGYDALALGAVADTDAPGRIKRNMPDPVPVLIIGRLAIDQSLHGEGIGQALLRDAVLRTLQASDIAGIRAVLVHANPTSPSAFTRRMGLLLRPWIQ